MCRATARHMVAGFTSMSEFISQLHERPLLADGGMGTSILARGVGYDESYELLNLNRPELISEIHRSYAAAGADVLEANTFGANHLRQEQYGQQSRVREMNITGVKLARAAARAGMFVTGSIGPLGARLAPLGAVTAGDAYAAFYEQAGAQAEAGVDAFVLETFGDLAEIEQAIKAARAAAPDVPVIALMTFGRDNMTLLGNTPEEVAQRLASLGAAVVGANCSTGPQRMREVMGRISALKLKTLLGAMPNAGYPEVRGDRLLYPATPAYFGQTAQQFADMGLRFIGGCCGTTAEHTRAMRQALDARSKPVVQTAVTAQSSVVAAAPERVDAAPTALARALANKHFVVTVEIEPPRSFSTIEVEQTAQMLKDAGATVLDIADAPLAKLRLNGMVLAHRVQENVGIECVLHFPVRGRNLLRVQSDLLGAHALNIRNLFVTMGDPTKIGDFPQASDSHDIVPTGLMQLLAEKFNHGVDQAGNRLGAPTSFVTGCALNLTPPTDEAMEKEANLLKKKIDCGANFALTQPVFDVARAERFLDFYASKFGPLTLPVLAGILPLASVRHAEFFRNEVPGIVIGDDLIARLNGVGNKTRTEGLKIAIETIAALRSRLAGVYLIPAFERFDVIARVIDAIR